MLVNIKHSTVIQLGSGSLANGRVLSGAFYAQRFQELICLLLFTDCFMKISPQSLEEKYL